MTFINKNYSYSHFRFAKFRIDLDCSRATNKPRTLDSPGGVEIFLACYLVVLCLRHCVVLVPGAP